MTTTALSGSQDRGGNEGIRGRFVGAWRLVWLEEQGADGKIHRADCTGLLVYTRDAGGHFENFALYELLRRRCKLIVACDASCDPSYTFADLHNAMERCRTDFGIEITRETHLLLPQDARVSGHFDVCRIHYTPGEDGDSGVLVHFRPALKKDDPEDLLGYARINHAFPDDSTADQWFDEDHFENYRNLGYVTARSAKKELRDAVTSVLG